MIQFSGSRSVQVAVAAVIVTLCASAAGIAQAHISDKTHSDASVPPSKLREPTFTPSPLPSGGYHFLSEGLDVVPVAGPTPTEVLPLAEAVKRFEAQAGVPPADAPSGKLARVSNGDFGTPFDGDENTFRNRLSWILTFPNATPDVRGPSYLTSADREKIANGLHCTDTGIIDATSGDFITYFQDCKPQ